MDTPIEKVHDLLNRPHSSADFSPAARTNNDLQQQLSFMQQALKELQHAGV